MDKNHHIAKNGQNGISFGVISHRYRARIMSNIQIMLQIVYAKTREARE